MPNFAARIAAAADRWPDRPAIELLRGDEVVTTTYRELDDGSARLGGWLLERGISPDDRAAILADNDAPWIAAYLAVLRIGAVAVPLDTAYKAHQVRTVLENSGARLLFTTPKYLETGRAAIAPLTASSPALVLLSGSAPDAVDATIFGAPRSPAPVAEVADAAAAVILYTSGTTADPKGVVLTHGNLDAERAGAFAVVDVGADDAILGVLPLFHALAQMANLLLPLTVGARVVFLETISSSSLVAALDRRGITIFACVPQFFYLIHQRVMSEVARKGRLARTLVRALIGANVWLRDRAGWNPGKRIFARVHRTLGARMRLLVTGGSKFDPAIGRDLYGLGFTILNAYGLTETSGGATIMRPADRFTSSVGQPFPGVEITIARGGNDAGTDGEILIRGPIVMREYFNRADATADTLCDGWLHTGDLGFLDADGRLFITGRKKEIIVLASGKNLYPEEIEAHYRQSAFIKELCVLGLARPGEPASERLHAVIVPDEQALRDRGIVNLRELVRFEIETLSVQLPAHKRILSYDISLEPLPRTTTAKIRRHQVELDVRSRAASGPETDSAPLTESDQTWLAEDGNAAAMTAVGERLKRIGIRPGANLELDLGLDSMERVELLTALEHRFATRVSPEVRATIFTVRALVDAVRTAARPAAAESTAPAELPWASILATPPDPDIDAMLAQRKPVRALVFFTMIRTAGVIARLVPGFRVSGVDQLPAAGPFIISPNHQAYLDPFFLAAALPFRTLREVFFVGAAEYFETPLTRWLARQVNIVPVDPDAHLTAAMRAGAAGLRRGKVLILFPEGERSIDGDLKKFRKGAAILAAHLNAPIVPVGLDGLFELWPRGRRFNWRGLLPGRARPVTLRFGAPIRVAPGAYADGTQVLRDRVQTLLSAAARTTSRFSWRTQ